MSFLLLWVSECHDQAFLNNLNRLFLAFSLAWNSVRVIVCRRFVTFEVFKSVFARIYDNHGVVQGHFPAWTKRPRTSWGYLAAIIRFEWFPQTLNSTKKKLFINRTSINRCHVFNITRTTSLLSPCCCNGAKTKSKVVWPLFSWPKDPHKVVKCKHISKLNNR